MEFKKLSDLNDYYAVPDYQRDYEWTNAENNTLIDDIYDVVDDHLTNSNAKKHFIGAIVTVPYAGNVSSNGVLNLVKDFGVKEENIRHIVDGQQRLTSLSVLSATLLDFIVSDVDFSEETKDVARDYLRDTLNGKDSARGLKEKLPRLILSSNTGGCYILDILHKNLHVTTNRVYKGAKRLLAAQNLFKESLTQKKKEMLDQGWDNRAVSNYFEQLVLAITEELIFVEIRCDDTANAFQVFDSLNGKGMDLTAVDRIKNIFLSWNPGPESLRRWESFVAVTNDDYLLGFFISLLFYEKKVRVQKNKLPNDFSDIYETQAKLNFEGLYQNLKTQGEIYNKLRTASTGIVKTDSLLAEFRALQLDQVYVLIYAVAFECGIDNAKFNDFLKTFISLIVRMQVCQQSMNRLDKLFTLCITNLRNSMWKIDDVIQKLQNEINVNVPDLKFKMNFATFAPTSDSIAKYYLQKIEEYMHLQKGVRKPQKRDDIEVEHIIPRAMEYKEWYKGKALPPDEVLYSYKETVIESIGNKALLYHDDNAAASNKPYADKLIIYKNGKKNQTEGVPQNTFAMIKELITKYPVFFGHEEVAERACEFAEFAVNIWK